MALKCLTYPDEAPTFSLSHCKRFAWSLRKEGALGPSEDLASADQKSSLAQQVRPHQLEQYFPCHETGPAHGSQKRGIEVEKMSFCCLLQIQVQDLGSYSRMQATSRGCQCMHAPILPVDVQQLHKSIYTCLAGPSGAGSATCAQGILDRGTPSLASTMMAALLVKSLQCTKLDMGMRDQLLGNISFVRITSFT